MKAVEVKRRIAELKKEHEDMIKADLEILQPAIVSEMTKMIIAQVGRKTEKIAIGQGEIIKRLKDADEIGRDVIARNPELISGIIKERMHDLGFSVYNSSLYSF